MKKFFAGGICFLWLVILPDAVWPMRERPSPEPTVSVPAEKSPPLTLLDCYELALERSETLAIQKEDIEEAEAQLFLAASEALGDIDFEMTDKRQDVQKGGGEGSVGTSLSDPARRERKFIIKQPLFQGFKALGALTGAGSLKKEQKEEWFRAKELLFLDVANAFYGLLREKKDLETIDGIHALFLERVKELEEREQIGRSRTSEVVTAKARIKILEAERSRKRGAHAVAQFTLEFLTGVELSGRLLQEEELPQEALEELEGYMKDLEERADVEAAEQSVKTAWRGVIVEQSSLWPEISVEHNQYIRREGFQSNLDWDFLFKINVPLFRGGETTGKIKQAVSRWKKEKLNHSLAKRQAEFEIKESFQNWISSLDELQALQEAVKASEENFTLQKEEYRRSLVGNLEVLEALESLHETQREANRAHYQMKQNYWGLRVAAGEVL